MDNHHSTLLNWTYFCQGKSMDELRQTLLLTTLELENTRLKAQEELKIRDDEINQLKDLLNRAIHDKNEAQRLVFDKLLFQQSCPLSAGISSIEDDSRKVLESNNGFSSSDCDESIVSSSPIIDTILARQSPSLPLDQEQEYPIVIDKPLPEKGKFLQAVMKAGPLLQTLLLAGPLPQWRHPPPPLDSYQIPPPPVVIPSPPPPQPPPVTQTFQAQSLFQDSITGFNSSINTNCGRLNKKRGGLFDDSNSSIDTKYQRVVL